MKFVTHKKNWAAESRELYDSTRPIMKCTKP